jgi:hypothetical protein
MGKQLASVPDSAIGGNSNRSRGGQQAPVQDLVGARRE